jgi:hypothetical protein
VLSAGSFSGSDALELHQALHRIATSILPFHSRRQTTRICVNIITLSFLDTYLHTQPGQKAINARVGTTRERLWSHELYFVILGLYIRFILRQIGVDWAVSC